jgi:hypothetical protein
MKRFRFELIALFFTLLGLFWRAQKFLERPLYSDELQQIQVGMGDLRPFWQRISYGEVANFPGDYLLTYPFIQLFGPDNRWAIATPHIIATIIGFFLLYLICKKNIKSSLAVTIVFALFCFNHNLIFHAFEIRPYAVLPTLSLATFYYAQQVFSGQARSQIKRFLIGLLFIATAAYHAYGIFIVGLVCAYFVCIELSSHSLKDVFNRLGSLVVCCGILALIVFIWYFSGKNKVSTQEAFLGRNIYTFEYISNPVVAPLAFMKSVFGNLVGYKKFYPFLIGVTAAWLLSRQRLQLLGFLLVLVVFPILLILTSDTIKGYWFLQRQFIWVTPLFLFYIGWCWDEVIVRLSHSKGSL